MLERKTIGFEVKEVNEEEGTFVGYAATPVTALKSTRTCTL